MATPSFSNAAIARRSRSSIAGSGPRRSALAKSVPRGSVIVGIRTCPLPARRSRPVPRASARRLRRGFRCRPSDGPASPATKSSAPKNSPTLIWCCSACCATGPILPARMSCLFVVEFHRGHSILAPESRTALPHLASSLCWKLGEGVTGHDVDAARPTAPSCLRNASLRDDALDRAGQRGGRGSRHPGRPEHAPPRGGLEAVIAGLGDGRHIGQRRLNASCSKARAPAACRPARSTAPIAAGQT